MTAVSLDPRRVIQDWQRPIYNLALRRLGNEADAADACQETFIKILANLRQLRSADRLKPWVYRIAHNTISGLQSRAGRRRRAEDAAPTPVFEDADLEGWEQRDRVRAALASLSVEHRAVIELHFFQELSQREVGAALDLSQSAVHARLKRGLERLRVALGGSMALLAPDWVAVPRSLARNLAALPLASSPPAPRASSSIKASILAASLGALTFVGVLRVLQEPAASPAQTMMVRAGRGSSPRSPKRRAETERRPRPEPVARTDQRGSDAPRPTRVTREAPAVRARSLPERPAELGRALRVWLQREESTRIVRFRLLELAYKQGNFFREQGRYADRGELPGFLEDPSGYRLFIEAVTTELGAGWWAAADPAPGSGLRAFYIREDRQLSSSMAGSIRPVGPGDTRPSQGAVTDEQGLLPEQRASLSGLLRDQEGFIAAAESLLANPHEPLREALILSFCQFRRLGLPISAPLRQTINRALIFELEDAEADLRGGLLYGLDLASDPESAALALPRMIELATDRNTSLSLAAFESIAAIRSEESARLLRSIAADPSQRVMARRLALVCYDSEREDAIAFAARFKNDREPQLRAMAWGLITRAAKLHPRLPSSVLDDFFTESIPKIRWRIGQALRASGDARFADLLDARAAGADPKRQAEARAIVEDLRRAGR